MKLKLTDLDPHFVKRVSPLDYELTDNLTEADGLAMQCPACYWADQRTGSGQLGHTMVLWEDPEHWCFVGHDYRDLSLMAGRVMVTLDGHHGRIYIKDGRVDFC